MVGDPDAVFQRRKPSNVDIDEIERRLRKPVHRKIPNGNTIGPVETVIMAVGALGLGVILAAGGAF